MKLNKILLILLLPLTLGSCKKFLEIDPPQDKLISETVFENDETAIAALTSIYSRMNIENNSFAYDFCFQFGIAADELKNYSSAVDVVTLYTNALNQLSPVRPSYWQTGYNFVYNANSAYESCLRSTTLTPAVKQQLMAEALFIRAYWFFYLTNIYGDIPPLGT